MGHFNFIIQQSCHNSWDAFFTSQPVRNELTKIEKSISSQVISPAPNDVFKVFQCDLEKLKVVIMGQDPYPQPNVATGRSFEVGNISSWGALRRKNSNASLRNILKLLHHNKRMTSKVQGIKVVMNDNKFTSNILPPNKIFANLEQQGVLFLNAALTCPQGSTKKSNAHAKIWSNFTKLLLDFIDANKKTYIGSYGAKLKNMTVVFVMELSITPTIHVTISLVQNLFTLKIISVKLNAFTGLNNRNVQP